MQSNDKMAKNCYSSSCEVPCGMESLAKRQYDMQKPFLVWLAFDWLLQVSGIKFWGVGSIPQDAHECIKKDEDLQTFIHTTWCAYAKKMKMAWDDTY
jgi:hypothetical protein